MKEKNKQGKIYKNKNVNIKQERFISTKLKCKNTGKENWKKRMIYNEV